MLLYYITDRHGFSGAEADQRVRLLAKIAEAARCGVDFIQLREKDLSPRELDRLAREAVQVVRDHTPLEPRPTSARSEHGTRILINSRTDIALAVGADGVHLTSTDIAASEARAIHGKFLADDREEKRDFLVAVSCHTSQEIRLAEAHGANFAVFAPVFEKKVRDAERGRDVPATAAETAALQAKRGGDVTLFSRSQDQGLSALTKACKSLAFPNNVEGVGTSAMPVLALGGITLGNARECVAAGAAGIAAIRLFQENDVAEIMSKLKG